MTKNKGAKHHFTIGFDSKKNTKNIGIDIRSQIRGHSAALYLATISFIVIVDVICQGLNANEKEIITDIV